MQTDVGIASSPVSIVKLRLGAGGPHLSLAHLRWPEHIAAAVHRGCSIVLLPLKFYLYLYLINDN